LTAQSALAESTLFPDIEFCRPLEQHTASPKTTALNPLVLVEVTSDSSEEYDTVDKLAFYKTSSTLREYIVVSHREPVWSSTVAPKANGRPAQRSRAAASGWPVSRPSLPLTMCIEPVRSPDPPARECSE
jgi:hypothetical protein